MKYFSASQEKLLYMALLRLKSSYDDLLDWTEDEYSYDSYRLCSFCGIALCVGACNN